MSNLEKKVNALCRMVLAKEDAAWDQARGELEQLMKQPANHQDSDATTALIFKALRELGVPSGILGHKYLVQAVHLAMENPDIIHNTTNDGGLYPAVAEMNGTTPGRVERAIRHGIESGWLRTDQEVLMRYFGGTVHPDKGKPTNREYIGTLAQHLSLQYCEV